MDPGRPPVYAFLVGVAKAGTTWFSACLAEHPELCVSVPKEPVHFTRGDMGPAAWRAYAEHFQHARRGERLIDANIRTFTDNPDAPDLIKRHYPEALFILVLRDPVKRAYSNFWHNQFARDDGPQAGPAEFLERSDDAPAWNRSDYARHLARWLERFPRERFLVLVVDDPATGARDLVRQAYAFLGVDPTFEPSYVARRLRPPTRPGSLLQRFYHVAEALRRAGLGRLVDLAKRRGAEGAFQSRRTSYPPMPPEIEAAARQRTAASVARLEEMLGREFPAWKP